MSFAIQNYTELKPNRNPNQDIQLTFYQIKSFTSV